MNDIAEHIRKMGDLKYPEYKQKRPLYGFFFNGGVDVARFELFKKYYEHLNDTPSKIFCFIGTTNTA